MGGLQPGEKSRLLNWKGPKAAVAICYELSDGTAISKAVKEGAQWLLTIANLDPYPLGLHNQFIAISQLRSIESGRELLSVANTGPTALVSSTGVVKRLLPSFSQGLAVDKLYLYKGTTLYTTWGDFPLVLFCIFSTTFLYYSEGKN